MQFLSLQMDRLEEVWCKINVGQQELGAKLLAVVLCLQECGVWIRGGTIDGNTSMMGVIMLNWVSAEEQMRQGSRVDGCR
jgi:hypothetical protein